MKTQKSHLKMQTPLAALAALMVVGALAGCGGGSNSGPGGTTITPAQLAGTYKKIKLAAPSGQSTSCPGTLTDIQEDCGANDIVLFNSDGTFTLTDTGQSAASGIYTLSGSKLTVKVGTATSVNTVTLSGNTLIFKETAYSDTANPSDDSDGVITTLTKQ